MRYHISDWTVRLVAIYYSLLTRMKCTARASDGGEIHSIVASRMAQQQV